MHRPLLPPLHPHPPPHWLPPRSSPNSRTRTANSSKEQTKNPTEKTPLLPRAQRLVLTNQIKSLLHLYPQTPTNNSSRLPLPHILLPLTLWQSNWRLLPPTQRDRDLDLPVIVAVLVKSSVTPRYSYCLLWIRSTSRKMSNQNQSTPISPIVTSSPSTLNQATNTTKSSRMKNMR